MNRKRNIREAGSLPIVKHKKPCRECPFRRTSVRGWLGGGKVLDWCSDLMFGDTAFVCHMASRNDKYHFCAGSMIHYRNNLKRPRDAEFAKAVECYEPDIEAVFQWTAEFRDHHLSGLLSNGEEKEK